MKKLRWIMIVLFVSVVIQGAMAQDSSSLNEKTVMLTSTDISVDQDSDHILLSDLLSTLEQYFDVTFLYKDEVMTHKYVQRDKIEIGEQTGQELSRILDQLGLTFQQIDTQTYVLLEKELSLQVARAQEEISGTVTDAETGETLPGVNVLVKGTTTGTSTDNEGSFELTVESLQDTLVVSFVGYQTQEVSIDGRTEIEISMQSQAIAGEELVVVGYGEVEREDVTSSISSMNTQDINDLTVSRADQALMGKIAGVQVKPSDGTPGAAPQIRIRGVGSISAGSEPLFVVDGVPTDNIQTINPNDIESMDILKDASATAIYGSRGANGVVIINTKRGVAGEMDISYDASIGFQQVSKMPEFMDAREQAEYASYAVRNRNLDLGNDISGPPTSWDFAMPQTVVDVLEGQNTTDVNALEEVMRIAPEQQHKLSISGGTENLQYAVSGEYLNQEGIIKNSGFDRFSLRTNLDAQLTEQFSVRLNINPTFTDSWGQDPRGTGYGTSILGNAASINPYNPLFDENGDYFIFRGLPEVGDFPNPMTLVNEMVSSRQGTRFIGNINAEYAILDELRFNILLGGDLLSTKSMEFVPHLPSLLNTSAEGEDNSLMRTNWITEYTLNYDSSFGDHNLAGLVGFTAQKERGESNFLESNNYPNNLIPSLSAVGGLLTDGSSDVYEWSLISYLARLNYNYNNKYYLTASVRTDGSSRFGSNNKYATFPAVSLAWRVSNESFFDENVNFLSDLKIRASYGETGNNNIGNYESLATVNNVLYPLENNPVTGFSPSRLPNPSLTWEKQQSVNAGIDAEFFDGRLNLTIDHFRTRNTDLLLDVNVPDISGFSSSLTNIGEVKNTGWEFELSTLNVAVRNSFQWTTDFNLSTYKNEVVKLGPKGDPIIGDMHITRIGEPMGMLYGLLVDGHFKSQEEFEAGPHYAPGSALGSHLGDIRFVDLSGPEGVPDGIIDSYDRTVIGSPYPDFYYGMTNRFSYKNFSLSFSLQGVYGNKVMSEAKRVSMRGEFRVNQLAVLNNFWKSEEEPGDSPRPNDEPTGGIREISERFLDEGSYLRINNILLSYLLPDNFSQSLNLNSLRVYANATNPFIFTKNEGFNPDVSNSQNPLNPGVDNNLYPLARSITLGVNIGF